MSRELNKWEASYYKEKLEHGDRCECDRCNK